MANKREFKKYVNTVCDNVAGEMTFAADTTEGVNRDSVHEAVIDVIRTGANAIMKGNVKFDKTRKAFESAHLYDVAKRKFYHELFAKINKEFADGINAALAKFNAAMPKAE